MNLVMKFGLLALYLTFNTLYVKSQYLDTSLSVNARVNNLISQMTLAEKISQLALRVDFALTH